MEVIEHFQQKLNKSSDSNEMREYQLSLSIKMWHLNDISRENDFIFSVYSSVWREKNWRLPKKYLKYIQNFIYSI